MPRTTNRTPRFYRKPLRVWGFTLEQLGVLAVAAVAIYACLKLLPDGLPLMARTSLGAALVGYPLYLVFTADAANRSVFEKPRRVLHALTAPREYPTGEARTGPLRFATYDRPTEEDPDDE